MSKQDEVKLAPREMSLLVSLLAAPKHPQTKALLKGLSIEARSIVAICWPKLGMGYAKMPLGFGKFTAKKQSECRCAASEFSKMIKARKIESEMRGRRSQQRELVD